MRLCLSRYMVFDSHKKHDVLTIKEMQEKGFERLNCALRFLVICIKKRFPPRNRLFFINPTINPSDISDKRKSVRVRYSCFTGSAIETTVTLTTSRFPANR